MEEWLTDKRRREPACAGLVVVIIFAVIGVATSEPMNRLRS
jgi:hypothetical protein